MKTEMHDGDIVEIKLKGGDEWIRGIVLKASKQRVEMFNYASRFDRYDRTQTGEDWIAEWRVLLPAWQE